VLDGFPRTLAQAEQAYERAKVSGQVADAVVYLDVPDDVARTRLAGRNTGRSDDSDGEVIDNRLEVFHRQTRPLLDYYRGRGILVTVDATRPPDEVSTAMLDGIAAVAARTVD
jgi:adenylate kinase